MVRFPVQQVATSSGPGAGAGVISNDFHNRRDLAPNLCALFVEPAYRRQGIARRLLGDRVPIPNRL